MLEKVKLPLFLAAASAQVLGIIFLFIYIPLSIAFFIAYGVLLFALLVVFIKQRMQEKKEDDNNDYRDY
ncbi:hypothetical protein GJU40_04870 [Bacillus lacus]|uniref:Uncharacterized protein n=1 Tax=Metabacillus lacus TaxID=1983721 RepID=A0A7X2IX90_9BACI|nr:hypothetical protein [Metabacillus lacus]MRX71507.1 hypothetical protein [Metabacillus lacus]